MQIYGRKDPWQRKDGRFFFRFFDRCFVRRSKDQKLPFILFSIAFLSKWKSACYSHFCLIYSQARLLEALIVIMLSKFKSARAQGKRMNELMKGR